MQGGLLNYIIMKTIISARRDILLDVQGSNVWSGQQVQSFNADAISWGALGQQVCAASLVPRGHPAHLSPAALLPQRAIRHRAVLHPDRPRRPPSLLDSPPVLPQARCQRECALGHTPKLFV